MFWCMSDEKRDKIFREKIISNNEEVKRSLDTIARLQQQVDKLSSGVDIQTLKKHYKGLQDERKRLCGLIKQYEQQVPYWRKRLSTQREWERKYNPLAQEVETLQEKERRCKQEIEELQSKVRDPIELEDELRQLKSQKKTLKEKNKALQQKSKNLQKEIAKQDQLCEKIRIKQDKCAKLLQQNLQETVKQLHEIERSKEQYRTVKAQPGCLNWDMLKIEDENKGNSKCVEALSLLTNPSDRERELLQQTSTLQKQLATLRADFEYLKTNSNLKEKNLLKENEDLKKMLEDAWRDLKLNSDTLTKTVFNSKDLLTTLKSELARTTTQLENKWQTHKTLEMAVKSMCTCLAGSVRKAELCLAAHTETERKMTRAWQEVRQELLACPQPEGMSPQQQSAVTNAQESLSVLLSKPCSKCGLTVKLQEDRNKDLVSENNDLQDQISKLEEEKTKRETTLKKLEQELADSLAYGKVVTRYRQDLEKYLGLLKRNFADSKDQYVEAKKCNNDLKSMLDEKEKDLVQIKSKMEDLEVQLQKERSSCSQLKNRLDSLKHVSCRHDNLERTNKQLEEELIDLRSRMEISQMEQSRLEQRCRDTEDSARQELQQKLDEVNHIMWTQHLKQIIGSA